LPSNLRDLCDDVRRELILKAKNHKGLGPLLQGENIRELIERASSGFYENADESVEALLDGTGSLLDSLEEEINQFLEVVKMEGSRQKQSTSRVILIEPPQRPREKQHVPHESTVQETNQTVGNSFISLDQHLMPNRQVTQGNETCCFCMEAIQKPVRCKQCANVSHLACCEKEKIIYNDQIMYCGICGKFVGFCMIFLMQVGCFCETIWRFSIQCHV